LANDLKPSTPLNLNAAADPADFSFAVQDLNAESVDTSSVITYDPSNQSSLLVLRKKIQDLYRTKKIPKSEYLGVVLKVEDEVDSVNNKINKRIIVDVPNKDLNAVVHQDFIDPSADLDLEHKVFFPVSEKVAKEELPHVGDLVRVSIPPDYFFSKVTNPRNNKYLGIFDNNIVSALAPPSTSNNRQAEPKLDFTKAQAQDSLFTFKPEFPINETDLVSLPFANSNDFLVTSLPALRTPPRGGAAERLGQRVQSHIAIDVGMPIGTPIYACTDHTLVNTEFNGPKTDSDSSTPGFGNYIKATNNKFIFIYGHLKEKVLPSDPRNKRTDNVYKKGDLIGFSGNSGNKPSSPYAPHLHFEIKDIKTNKKINPLYILKGNIKINDEMQKKFSFKQNTLLLPLALETNKENIGILDLTKEDPQLPPPQKTFAKPSAPKVRFNINLASLEEENKAQPQNIPQPVEEIEADEILDLVSTIDGETNSLPVSKPYLPIVKFEADLSKNVNVASKRGTKFIKIREDILPDLKKIKDILDTYDARMTMNFIDVSLSNNTSKFAQVGLEVQLNNNAGLNLESNYDLDDYLIGPDYSVQYGVGYKLKVYATTKRNINVFESKYIFQPSIVDIYDIKSTYLKKQPKIIKVFKRLIDLSKIFEDFGFIQVPPSQDFFIKSDFKKSNWFRFYKPNKLQVGTSYKQMLSTVYKKNNNPIWNSQDMFWDGSKFI